MLSKFMPYTPARKVSGSMIVEIRVSTFMISFMRCADSEWNASNTACSSLCSVSRRSATCAMCSCTSRKKGRASWGISSNSARARRASTPV